MIPTITDENKRKIPIEIADGENENEKILYITFMEDNQIDVVQFESTTKAGKV